MELPRPKSVIQEVLLHMIKNSTTSIKSFPTLSGFRTRISELKRFYGVEFDTQMLTGVNKYGKEFKYACHRIPAEYLQKAIDVYLKMHKLPSE